MFFRQFSAIILATSLATGCGPVASTPTEKAVASSVDQSDKSADLPKKPDNTTDSIKKIQPVVSAKKKEDESIPTGGKFWSSPVKASRDGMTFTPGIRFWIWPVEDREFEAKEGNLSIKFHWKLRPDQKAPQEQNDGVFAHIDFLSEASGTTNINMQSHRLKLKTNASEGIVDVTFDLKDFSGKGEVLFFLSGESFVPKNTDSNLLLLKATYPK